MRLGMVGKGGGWEWCRRERLGKEREVMEGRLGEVHGRGR